MQQLTSGNQKMSTPKTPAPDSGGRNFEPSLFSLLKPLRIWLCLSVLITLSACSTTALQSEYAANQPTLSVREFFDGTLSAHGIIKNRSGLVTRYFNANVEASWDANGVGTISEYFTYDDGENAERIWKLVPKAPNQYIATANDVVGESTITVKGNSLFMEYVLQLPRKDSTIEVNIDDRMYLVNNKVIINEGVIRKFGIRIGSVTLSFTKE